MRHPHPVAFAVLALVLATPFCLATGEEGATPRPPCVVVTLSPPDAYLTEPCAPPGPTGPVTPREPAS